MGKLPGKKKFKNTQFGSRALAGARDGTGGLVNPDGSTSSVRTGTWDIPGKGGRTDVMVAPTIRQDPVTGELVRLSPDEALAQALGLGDFVRVRGGRTPEKIEKARAKGDAKSRQFSDLLGMLTEALERQQALDRNQR